MRTAGEDVNPFSGRAVGFRSRRDRSRLQRTRGDAVLVLEGRGVISGIRVAQELDGVELQVITVELDAKVHSEHAIKLLTYCHWYNLVMVVSALTMTRRIGIVSIKGSNFTWR